MCRRLTRRNWSRLKNSVRSQALSKTLSAADRDNVCLCLCLRLHLHGYMCLLVTVVMIAEYLFSSVTVVSMSLLFSTIRMKSSPQSIGNKFKRNSRSCVVLKSLFVSMRRLPEIHVLALLNVHKHCTIVRVVDRPSHKCLCPPTSGSCCLILPCSSSSTPTGSRYVRAHTGRAVVKHDACARD